MSSDNTVNHLITTGIGISVLAGIVSGVCYVLAHNYRRSHSNRKKNQDWCCRICENNYSHSTGLNIFKKEKLINCSKCGAKVCIEKCSKFVQQNAKWLCRNCLVRQKSSWITNVFAAVQQNSDEMSIMMDNSSRSASSSSSSSSNTNSDFNSLQKLNKEQIRNFIEKLVNVMLGENVDNASVSMIYNNRQYLRLFTSYHDDLINALTDLGSSLIISMSNPPIIGQLQQHQPVQPPCTAHTTLKQLIQKIISEAVNLPLLETAQVHPASEDTENRTYEDLLATAIINKAVNNYQQNLPNCSSTTSISSRVSSKYRDDKEYFFGEETLDSKWKITSDFDTTSVSSVEEWLQGESSSSNGRKYVDKSTLMIKQDINEELDDDNSDSEDDAEYFRSNSSLLYESESNWLLQKKKFPGGHSPVPVPMLVPKPSIDAKVLIGDKPLDDTSDLSDIGSDLEELIQPLRHQKSKHLIDKEKSINSNVIIINANNDEQSESSTDSGVKEVNGEAPSELIIKTDNSLDDDNLESSFISVYSNNEKEAEYTEKYATLNRQILDSPSSTSKKSSDSANSIQNTEKDDLDEEFIGGTYSKKEKEKWKHAVELKNNPYSTKNIEKRIVQRSNSSAGSAFGPDYYARLAKNPSGSGKIHSQVNGVTWPPSSDPPSVELAEFSEPVIVKENLIADISSSLSLSLSSAAEICETPPELPKSSPPPKPTDLEIDGIHYALKAIVTPTEQEEEEELEAKMSFTTETYSTDTEGSSYVNLYDVEHSQVVMKSKNENVHIPIKGNNGASIIRENNNVALKSPMMRNVHSQSIADNFESSPSKVMHQKKDNTLISKIYKDPKVRLFALNSREDILSGDNIKKKNIDSSSPSMNLVSENNTASESGRNGKMSFSGSELPNGNNTPKSSKSFIYNSQEELLLSNDDLSSIPRRKDNTLITKIYQDPNVIKFAFKNHKDAVMDYQKATGNNSSSVDDVVETAASNKHQYSPNYKNSFSGEISSLESSQISIEEEKETEFKANNESLKIIQEKQMVKKALSKLFINNNNNNNIENPPLSRSTSIDDLGNIRVSVWNLRKQFENNDDSNNKPVISSLTARSLSKQVKEILKETK